MLNILFREDSCIQVSLYSNIVTYISSSFVIYENV